MRILLMVLLLANLGLFAWQQWYDPARVAGLPRGEPDSELGSGLRLVGEREIPVNDTPALAGGSVTSTESGADDAAPEAADEAVAGEERAQRPLSGEEDALQASCATLGPFEQLEIAQIAEERLEVLGSRATVRESGGQIRAGFWVYLPPFPSRSEAKRIEDELRGKNVRDLFIVTASDQRNAISLGLFSTPERADQRAAEIGRLGYTPRVAERFRDATVYWVDFREQPDDPLEPQRIGVMDVSDVLPEKRNIPCADIAVNAGAA